MPFTRTYQELLEMISKALLDTQMCRNIVRRAGLQSSGGVAGSPAITAIWRGVNYAPQDAQVAFYTGQNLTPGAYIFPPFDSDGMGMQYALTDLTNVAYVRGCVSYAHGLNVDSSVAFMPIYSNNQQPTTLADWIAADGRTLADWDADLIGGTATWNPPGAVPDPAGTIAVGAGAGVFIRGPWYAPPLDALSPDITSVLFGVAALVKNLVTVDIYGVEFQAAAAPVSDAFNDYFFG